MSGSREEKPFKYLSTKKKNGEKQEKTVTQTEEKNTGANPGYFAKRYSTKHEAEKNTW